MSNNNTPFFTKENMARETRPQHWWNRGLQLTESQLREAMANTRSNKEAARWLGITDITYKKYAKNTFDEATGKSLFELHKNIAGKGVPKNWAGTQWKKNLDMMLVENQPINSVKIAKLKEALMKDGRLGYQCASCKFAEKRLTDMKTPLLLSFRNGKKSDWRLENLQWLCYNCYFLYIEDPFTNKMLQKVEAVPITNIETKEEFSSFYEIDDFYFEHLKNLGLDGQGDVLFKSPDIEDLSDSEDSFVDYKK